MYSYSYKSSFLNAVVDSEMLRKGKSNHDNIPNIPPSTLFSENVPHIPPITFLPESSADTVYPTVSTPIVAIGYDHRARPMSSKGTVLGCLIDVLMLE